MATTTLDHAPPSPAASDGSSASSGPPATPLTASLPMPTFMNLTSDDAVDGVPGGVKRVAKPPRRVNSAERRANHNAVERARRETLNGRFLDLASMLPNLCQIRRPSKSAIVNSSIAHLNASRRHRILAAQQLRAMKDESDALRSEINQWRTRAGLAHVVEPQRSDAFGLILSGELEFEAGDMYDGSEEGEDGYEGAVAGDGLYSGGGLYRYSEPPAYAETVATGSPPHASAPHTPPFAHAVYPPRHPDPASHPGYAYPAEAHAAAVAPAHYYAGAAPTTPAIVDPALAAAYENPAMSGYDQHERELVHPVPVHADWAAYEKQMHAQQLQQRQLGW